MEIVCNRCHQTVEAGHCYCPACGMPQLTYAADGIPGQPPAEHWSEAVRDAGSIEWKTALRVALLLAVPAGILCSDLSPVGGLGLFWMMMAASLTVRFYMVRQRPAWLTLGAGARIGLVTGLFAGWLALAISGGQLFFERYVLHQSAQIDAEWKSYVDASQNILVKMGYADATQMQAQRAWMLSPFGHAGYAVTGFIFTSLVLIFFATAGGALGARMMGRKRQPEI